MYRLVLTIICAVSIPALSQVPDGFPTIGKTDLPDAQFADPRYFTSESLFGYMDGGAELYREYGITDAVITEFDYQKHHFKCEVYRMNGPEEAFGIYSVSKFRCLGPTPFAEYGCLTKYQLQFCKGSYYISIINRSGTSLDSLISVRTESILAKKIKSDDVNLGNYFPDMVMDDFNQKAVMVKGKLGLMNGAGAWEDYFKDIKNYKAVIVTQKDKTLISAWFSNPDDFKVFTGVHGWGTCDLSVTGLKMTGGEIIRLLGDTHILVEIGN